MSVSQLQPQSVTLEEYEALPENVRAEVFDGQIYYTAGPPQVHQSVLLELCTLLNSYVKSRKGDCRVFPAPFDVKLSDHPLTVVQPDIMIVYDKGKLDENRCNGAPDFIIEIVSPGLPAAQMMMPFYQRGSFSAASSTGWKKTEKKSPSPLPYPKSKQKKMNGQF